MRAGPRVNEGRSEAAAAVINIKDWREMQRPAPAPLITYTKYLRRASSRSPRANSSRPLAIAVPLRPASVIKRSHRLDSLAGPASCGAKGARHGRGAAAPAAQCAGDRWLCCVARAATNRTPKRQTHTNNTTLVPH